MENLKKLEIIKELASLYEKLLKQHGDTPEVRLLIAEYTMGYMGASYGLHITSLWDFSSSCNGSLGLAISLN